MYGFEMYNHHCNTSLIAFSVNNSKFYYEYFGVVQARFAIIICYAIMLKNAQTFALLKLG